MYDSKNIISFALGLLDFGDTITDTFLLPIPRGAVSGKVIEISAFTKEAFVGTTTPAKIQVGVAGTLAKFGELIFGAAGAGTGDEAALGGRTSNARVYKATWNKDTDNVNYLTVTKVPTDGGGVTGQAYVWIHIQFDEIACQLSASGL